MISAEGVPALRLASVLSVPPALLVTPDGAGGCSRGHRSGRKLTCRAQAQCALSGSVSSLPAPSQLSRLDCVRSPGRPALCNTETSVCTQLQNPPGLQQPLREPTVRRLCSSQVVQHNANMNCNHSRRGPSALHRSKPGCVCFDAPASAGHSRSATRGVARSFVGHGSRKSSRRADVPGFVAQMP